VNINIPMEIPNLIDITQIAISYSSTVFLNKNGIIYNCGQNLSLGYTEEGLIKLPEINLLFIDIVTISHYGNHGHFINSNNQTIVFGSNSNGQLGKNIFKNQRFGLFKYIKHFPSD
jgi:alpha-tubulin suppressor-like RCC1 family protein